MFAAEKTLSKPFFSGVVDAVDGTKFALLPPTVMLTVPCCVIEISSPFGFFISVSTDISFCLSVTPGLSAT
ncbi:hypothetical protein [Campylobacter pinnipediorum]|uniref:hypothetical protein n=1 Tax=Campylobacter pinnipediorum TaxID=1965231 RepID=UPI000994C854|nr:hypothetical protein [Campylobacter pinnipediorum]AQW82024.1 hypothetical protein CPIN17260_1758 [Campylobacter pinnipediorum subsp. pinnipediorum]AQW83702.1 hypothetical protein CPIN17261_1719 [Campylobacter pinnipediorum subsp. pinnipediorum]